MPLTLYRETTYTLNGLVEDIRRGEIALPEIQRPFVWSPTKVRELFDSMYKGFPVGSLLLWSTGATSATRQIGTGTKESPPRLLIVDGQQRLTSLFAVLTGTPVIRKDYSESRIRIAFHPAEGRFAVTDAAVENDANYISDITEIWKDHRATRNSFLGRLSAARGIELDRKTERDLEDAIDRVRDLQHYPFKAVELDATLDEELVAEIFVRINSKGVQLNQADFILTLMSVFDEDGRKQLEAFSRAAKTPSTDGPSPYNHFIQPKPDQLLRVAVGLAFRRGKLETVYSILRGKDLETKQFSNERREQQFAHLNDAQTFALDLTNWHEFLLALTDAGYRSQRMVTSGNAILYTYVLYLVGRRDFDVDRMTLRRAIARWFFMAHTTGRYTSSPESAFEADIKRIESVRSGDATGFCEALEREISTVFTSDYWSITLPNRLATSSAKSPAGVAYWAALNILDAEVLFSSAKVSARLDPAITRVRDMERHHLFPKQHLKTLDIKRPRDTNQVGNMAFVEWPDNAAISKQAPSVYWPVYSARLGPGRLRQQLFWHALPLGWEQLEYTEFLQRRRLRIAEVIRVGFEQLSADADSPAASIGPRSVEQIIADGESMTIEFKSTARWNLHSCRADKKMEQVVVKTVAGFMNGEGGTLLVGVKDDGEVLGLEHDYSTLGSKGNRDGYELFLTQLFENGLSGPAATLVRTSFESIQGKDICRVSVAASANPVFAKALGAKTLTDFWVRTGNSTRQLVGTDMVEYQRAHWE